MENNINTNNRREEFVNSLNNLYGNKGLVPNNFKCKYSDLCLAEAKKFTREILGRGAQAHVGSNYSDDIRVVVLSVDTGDGGRDTIEERVTTIESIVYHAPTTNQHMRGTIELLRTIFPGKSDPDCLKLFSMTNAAKCSGSGRDKLPSGLYANCREIHEEEVNLMNPNIIISEGVDAYPSFLKKEYRLTEDDLLEFWNYIQIGNDSVKLVLKQILQNHIKKTIMDNGCIAIHIHTPHPSARHGQWQVFKTTSLPTIGLYVDFLKHSNFFTEASN